MLIKEYALQLSLVAQSVRTLACLRHGVHIAGSNPGVADFFANNFSFLKHLVYINDWLIPLFRMPAKL